MPRVYLDGIFDLTHYGHFELFRRARQQFSGGSGEPITIIVGICSDADTRHYKREPILSAEERARTVAACRWVDEVVVDAPWVITQEFLDSHAIDFVAHDGAPYAGDGGTDVYAYVKSVGKFRHLSRTPGISTTDLIERVLRSVSVSHSAF